MCGLIGYSGKDNYNIDKLKFLMLWNSIERGKDATGIYTPSSGLMKDKDAAADFFQNKLMQQLVPDNQLIAHVRAGTVGGKLAKCAHPFDYENIVLAHNGTLIDYQALATKYGLEWKDYDVDSQILAYGVNRAFGSNVHLEDLNIETLTEYKGAAAFLMYSKTHDKMFVWKDKERPLCFASDTAGNMYISSLADPLRCLDLGEVFSFKDNTLYCIDAGKIISRTEYKTYAETHTAEFTGKVKKRGEKGQKFPKLVKGQKGIERSTTSFKSYHLLDLWLLCTSQAFGIAKGAYERSATLKKDRYYRVTGYYGDEATVIQVRDENNTLGQAWMTDFDLQNCIPQKGDLYRLTSGIMHNKSKKPLFLKDDVVIVSKYNMDFGTVDLWHDGDQRTYEVSTEYCKPLTFEEGYDYIQKCKEAAKDNEIKEAEIIDETPLVDTLPENSPSPFLDFLDKDKEEEIQKDDNNLGDYVDTKAFLGVLDIIELQVDALEEDYNANLELTPKINEIKSTISCSKDQTYLKSLVEEVHS